MIAATKLSAAVAIGAGGALVGVLGGSNLGGPVTLHFTQTHLIFLGAVAGLLLALGGCCLATECTEARLQNRRQLVMLRRLVEITRDQRSG